MIENFQFDDYFWTGLLAEKIGARFENLADCVVNHVEHSNARMFLEKEIIFQLQRNMKDAEKLWKQAERSRAIEKRKALLSEKEN